MFLAIMNIKTSGTPFEGSGRPRTTRHPARSPFFPKWVIWEKGPKGGRGQGDRGRKAGSFDIRHSTFCGSAACLSTGSTVSPSIDDGSCERVFCPGGAGYFDMPCRRAFGTCLFRPSGTWEVVVLAFL